ncbi:cytochrome P450 [Streptomyces sp. LP05-1]|uniref:Cytochrome P450 n=1 Tax=Streptomyces pyxinae TaxID=2970734 RepID=A0ABT2CNR0_9ACTN|nr:cytochrome P450 [Streptomyces sp. LP05-1]MCS0639059.1 cytochrome P450 [Streptomyces sp. LP05-1]
MGLPLSLVRSLDLTDPATFAAHDPRDIWPEARRHEPVFWHEARDGKPGFWVVTRHADVLAAYQDADRLGSARGTVLDVLLRGDDPAGGKMLAVTDRPRHRQLRQLLLRAFSPRVLGPVTERIAARTLDLVRSVTGRGSFDFATEVADELPMNTICDLLSVPDGDRKELLRWNKMALSSEDPDSGELDALGARNEIVLYFMDLALERRASPGDDVISMIATAEVGGARLTPEEVALNCYSLILGGDESSRMSALVAVYELARHPEQWDALRAGEVALDTAVEEVLRWATPAMHFARTATQELEIAGRRIRAGDIVTLWNTSANDDETVFASPRAFDLARTPNKHLSFGHGPHFCVGAHLGRAGLRSLLSALVATVGRIEPHGEPERVHSTFLFGYRSLRVGFRPR